MQYYSALKIELEFANEEELHEKLNRVKGLNQSGISYSLFKSILENIHNESTAPHYLNSLNIDEWFKLFNKYNIPVSKEQIVIMFEYLSFYYTQWITKTNNKFVVRNNFPRLYFEILILKTLEV